MSSDIKKVLSELNSNKNNAVAFIYDDAKFSSGPLDGLMGTIKDVFATADAPTQSSSRILEGFEPQYDAEIVSRLRDSGAAIVAKTHLDELALGGTGEYSSWGLIKHPLDETRHVGGSSSGAAATINENIDFAIGSDTGDSVRLPASFIGKVGFKPSYGAVSRYGLFAFASSLDTVGWFTHDVATSIKVSEVLFGKDSKDMTSKKVDIQNPKLKKPKTVALLDVADLCKDYVSNEYKKIKTTLESSGVNVEMVKIDRKLLSTVTTVYRVVSYSETSSNNSNLNGIAFGSRQDGETWSDIMCKTRSAKLGKMAQRRFTLGAFYLDNNNQVDYFLRAQKVRRLISEFWKSLHEKYNLVIFPSTGEIANKFGEDRLDNLMSGILTTANLVGNPSMTLPWSNHEGMPFGLQLETNLYEDKELLSYSLWVEKLLGGQHE